MFFSILQVLQVVEVNFMLIHCVTTLDTTRFGHYLNFILEQQMKLVLLHDSTIALQSNENQAYGDSQQKLTVGTENWALALTLKYKTFAIYDTPTV